MVLSGKRRGAGAVQAEGPLQARPDGWSLRQDEAAIDGILDRLAEGLCFGRG